MGDFATWAHGASQYAGIEVDDDVLALAELIYSGVAQQLSVLDTLDLERFPVRAIDPREGPDVK
ncbi:MAG: hypothetical protein HKL86_02270 [Acidimicrobiaceae bacterium]|nr:hypothetical protein [Acidimicrobiaceae bacterium]